MKLLVRVIAIVVLIAGIPVVTWSQNLERDTSELPYRLRTGYTVDTFSDIYGTWHTGYMELQRKTAAGPVLGRLRYASRFGITGLQAELDFYPSIGKNWYGYLPAAFEASAGVRYPSFSTASVTIYTGTIAKYTGNWLFIVRPFR